MDAELRREMAFSVLQETSNIGTGNAITKLSQIVEMPIDTLVPKSDIISFTELHTFVADPMADYICAIAEVGGEIEGMILILMLPDTVSELVDLYKKTKKYKENPFEVAEEQTYKNVAEEMADSYLDAVTRFLSVELIRDELFIFQENIINILSIPASKFVVSHENLAITRTTFTLQDPEEVKGHIIYVPGVDAIEKVMEKFMVM